ncbi:MAG: hypothetical protein DCO96_10375 [Fluviicola sp. XM-24bin1]|nr:MAG: hypothetical protein DCO96_10375 [Fluviicola sp. XM-24bin1]
MKLFTITFTLILFGCTANSRPLDRMASVIKVKEYIDDSLGQDEAVYYFNFNGLEKKHRGASTRYSLNDSEFVTNLNDKQLRVKTAPGTYKMAFYINSNYYEVFTDSLTIDPQMVQVYRINLSKTPKIQGKPIERKVYKPVIYLYPKTETEIAVTVDIHGMNPFYYPNYNDVWNVTAQPNGDIEYNGESYNYLFWEADDEDHLEEVNVKEGFVIPRDEAVSFLEEKLTAIGFNSEERADFITFWGPKLAVNEKSLVRFEWNETCDKFADLTIEPKPDHIYRFYIFISALDGDFVLPPQVLPQFNREGFVVLEWGGQVSNYQPNTSL